MGKFLTIYLIVTGIGGAIALAMPGLVIIGLMMLIIPGLILGLMPTAFMWGAIFAVMWWPLRLVFGDWIAAALALAGTAAILIAIPAMANAHLQNVVDALRADDHDSPAPIALAGTVRFEPTDWAMAKNDDPVWQAYVDATNAAKGRVDWSRQPVACDVLCAAALFTPGIERVILAPAAAPGNTRKIPQAAEFRIDRTPGCARSIDPPGQNGPDLGFAALGELIDEWRVRVSQGNCIRRAPVTEKPTHIVAVSRWRVGPEAWRKEGRWSLAPRDIEVSRLEIRDANGAVLLRRTAIRAPRFHRLLWLATAGDMQNFHFEWGQSKPREGREPGAFKAAALLGEKTSLNVTSDPRFVADAARVQLSALLDDPARAAGDPGFALSERLLADIDKHGLREGDVALVTRMVADTRVRKFGGIGGIWGAVRKMGPEALRLREPIVARILGSTYPDDKENGTKQLGMVLSELPPRAFAELRADQARLMDDPDRRNWATGLVFRQADRGAAATPLLLRILTEAYQRRADWAVEEARIKARLVAEAKARFERTRVLEVRFSGDSKPDIERDMDRRQAAVNDLDAADAARRGLCQLGPEASSALPEIERLIASGVIPARVLEDREWQLMLARIGRPIESFRKAANQGGSDESLRKNLRQRLARFDPKQDCR